MVKWTPTVQAPGITLDEPLSCCTLVEQYGARLDSSVLPKWTLGSGPHDFNERSKCRGLVLAAGKVEIEVVFNWAPIFEALP